MKLHSHSAATRTLEGTPGNTTLPQCLSAGARPTTSIGQQSHEHHDHDRGCGDDDVDEVDEVDEDEDDDGIDEDDFDDYER